MQIDQLKRREFITLLGGGVAAGPVVAHAQQPGMPVIGFLDAGSAADRTHAVAAFRQGLAEAECGWWLSAEPQVWRTESSPMRAPRCLRTAYWFAAASERAA